jgi:hypothetical protein
MKKQYRIIFFVIILLLAGLLSYIGFTQVQFFTRMGMLEETVTQFYDDFEQQNASQGQGELLPDRFELMDLVLEKKYQLPFVSYANVKVSYAIRLTGSGPIEYTTSSGSQARINPNENETTDMMIQMVETLELQYLSGQYTISRVPKSSTYTEPYEQYLSL